MSDEDILYAAGCIALFSLGVIVGVILCTVFG
jgi:hypothetical protein